MIVSFRDAPIRKKFVAIILLTSGLVLAGSSIVFVVNEALSFRTDARKALESAADVIGKNSAAALKVGNANVAHESLQGFAGTIRSSPPICSRAKTRSLPPTSLRRRSPRIFPSRSNSSPAPGR